MGKLLPVLVFALAAVLAGCWQPPRADVHPSGEPRVIDRSVAVESTRIGIAQSFDPATRTITLFEPGDAVPKIYALASGTSVGEIRSGEHLRLTLTERLTIYVSHPGEAAPEVEAIASADSDARVLSIDRSYRLLTLLRTDGQRETFKVAQSVKLSAMEPGDEIAVESMQVVAVRPGQ